MLGLISDRFFQARRKGLLIFTGSCSAATGVIMATMGGALPFPLLIVLVLIFGFAGLGVTGLFMTMISELAGKDSAGQGAAAGLMGGNIGYFVVPPLFGMIVDVSHSYPLALASMALISALGAVAVSRVKERVGK